MPVGVPSGQDAGLLLLIAVPYLMAAAAFVVWLVLRARRAEGRRLHPTAKGKACRDGAPPAGAPHMARRGVRPPGG